MRVRAVISYDGSRFYGFQIQKDKRTIAGVIEWALKLIEIDSVVVGAGRTDKGVHALNQIIHFDIKDNSISLNRLKRHLNNSLIKEGIFFKFITETNTNFHILEATKSRLYRYVISFETPNPFMFNYVTYINHLDIDTMQQALLEFKGVHNFEMFKKSGTPTKNSIRNIKKCGIYKFREFYIIYFEANGFLRGQVRMMVDFIFKIAKGELSILDLKEQLECKKAHSRTLAPPNGLYFSRVNIKRD